MALSPTVLAALSIADVEYRYLNALGAVRPSLEDRREEIYTPDEHTYFAARSGLTPAASYRLSDHKYAFFKAQTGLTGTLADVSRAFWGAGSV